MASCQSGDAPDKDVVAPRGLRRLTHREYDNVVRDLLGDDSRPADSFGSEVYGNGFDNGSRGLVVLGPEYLAFRGAAETLAPLAVQDPKRLIGDCNPSPDPKPCVEAFLTGFAVKAYRRPLSSGEAERLRTVYAAGATDGGFAGGLELMLEAVLQSPSFLYREELGEHDATLPAGVVRLSPWELASSLSFLITGSLPDDALVQAVRDGRLQTTADASREAARLVATPRGRETVRDFLRQWLGLDQLSTLTKDRDVYPTFDRDLAASMSGELDGFFERVQTNGGSLQALFTSPESTIDARLAAIYGVRVASGDAFAPVILDPSTRKGILTRVGFLAAHADVDNSGPIQRGVYVLDDILCRPPPPRPPNIPPAPTQSEAIRGGLTTRQRFDEHVASPFCMTCHKTIDGVGFGFEEFDGIGAFRSLENGKPVDANGVLDGSDVDGPFHGVSELADRLAASQDVVDCFVRHAYRFAMGQDETANDGLLAAMRRGATSDTPLTDPFTKLVAQPGFVLRSTRQTGQTRHEEK